MSWFGPSLSVSSGGHVYDRTTGTWAGETQGSVGDGIDRSVADRAGIVLHGANGVEGFRFNNPGEASNGHSGGGGSGSASAQVTGSVTSAPNGGAGPGSAGVTQGGRKAGGAGAGSSMATIGGQHFGNKLKTKLQDDNTSLLIGGVYMEAPPGFSNADQWEELLGEPGDWIGGVVVGAGFAYHNFIHRPASYLADDRNSPLSADQYAGKGQPYLNGLGEWWTEANSPFGPDHPIPGFSSGGF